MKPIKKKTLIDAIEIGLEKDMIAREVADMAKVPPNRIHTQCKRLGVKLKKHRHRQTDEVKRLKAEGKTKDQIHELTGVPVGTISWILHGCDKYNQETNK